MTQGDKPLSLLLSVSLLQQTQRGWGMRKKPFSQNPLRTRKLRDTRLSNERGSDRLMRVPVKRTSSMGEKLGIFSTPACGGSIPFNLCCPGIGLQEPSAWAISAGFTSWPWLTRADHLGPGAGGGSCPACLAAGVLSAGVRLDGSSYRKGCYLSTIWKWTCGARRGAQTRKSFPWRSYSLDGGNELALPPWVILLPLGPGMGLLESHRTTESPCKGFPKAPHAPRSGPCPPWVLLGKVV